MMLFVVLDCMLANIGRANGSTARATVVAWDMATLDLAAYSPSYSSTYNVKPDGNSSIPCYYLAKY
jgi:hypothetical protein